ncbi:YraN family protein [Thermodesulfobacterium sp. TA1]|uniref:YraN family protein n=1 Tax=Thermodesulfobacterium sp. TA1 TaxID=2234087 RepID=UPI001232E791|nr:YraN family protein [Thermodesulfobacterium sp. TA1]QER42313.1 YraN family protein [Thermodesulfobacterium sp. TA1]
MIKKLFEVLSSKQKGGLAESLAEKYLKAQGFKIIAKNFRTKQGEIDLIAMKKDLLVFVEVKADFQGLDFIAEEKIDQRKIRKIFGVAEEFLFKNSKNLSKIKNIRFDVVVIRGEEVFHYEDAFQKDV